ncbi:MAG TPA: class II glutamine amidotransferase [Planctomycetaceae bacterium]|nr:class II glutamine amidotransferase [Planctomycetaceae bacterium]
MCRHYCFRANAPTKVECTLIRAQNGLLSQSRADRRGQAHSDGWGVAVYENGRPTVERRAVAAYEDLHFSTTVERVYAETIVAHVRKATVGEPSLANTHPFTHACWTFTHNGTVTGFHHLQKRLIHETLPELRGFRQGTTDSEQAFYWLLSRMARAGLSPEEPCRDLDGLAAVVAESVLTLAVLCEETSPAEPARLNILLTDGELTIASRWNNSLYWVRREGTHDCEICGIPHVHERPAHDYRAVLVASEPVSDEQWQELPDRSLLAVDAEIRPQVRQIAAAPSL